MLDENHEAHFNHSLIPIAAFHYIVSVICWMLNAELHVPSSNTLWLSASQKYRIFESTSKYIKTILQQHQPAGIINTNTEFSGEWHIIIIFTFTNDHLIILDWHKKSYLLEWMNSTEQCFLCAMKYIGCFMFHVEATWIATQWPRHRDIIMKRHCTEFPKA